jgi:outer membrane lipoprotein SlyB
MKTKMTVMAAVLALGVLSGTPSAQARNNYYRCHSCGVVTDVDRDRGRGDNHVGGGTVIGAIVGGALGNQVGKGDGRKAATVVGAVAGGAVGHQVEKDRRGRDVWRIEVRMDDGDYRTVTQYRYPDVRRGDHVQVRDGRVYMMR